MGSEKAEGGILGGLEGGKRVGERLADSFGGPVEGGDAFPCRVGAVAGSKGAPVEREAEGAVVPVVGRPDKAGLGQALAVVTVGEVV